MVEKPRGERKEESGRVITTGSAAYKESLKNIILRILAEGPAHGYTIMRKIEWITDGRWRPAAGTVYPMLEQLRREGLIEVVSVVEGRIRGGKRIVYGITEKGMEELARTLRFKAQSKVKFIKWMIIDGARILEERGLQGEAEEICRLIREGLESLLGDIRDC